MRLHRLQIDDACKVAGKEHEELGCTRPAHAQPGEERVDEALVVQLLGQVGQVIDADHQDADTPDQVDCEIPAMSMR